MTLFEINQQFHKRLDQIIEANETDSIFFITIKSTLGLSRIDYTLNRDREVGKESILTINNILSRLQMHEPIQYILGETQFYGFPIEVNKHVLIPRQETEELVSLIIEAQRSNKNNSTSNILDIGTGSGCIAIALAKHIRNSKVRAIDVSREALNVAKRNAGNNNASVEFRQHDILKKEPIDFKTDSFDQLKYNVIVSNPPYVRELEKNEIKPNVLDHEPKLALFVPDNNPLVFYSAIANFALENLVKLGWLFFEINQYLGSELKLLLENKGFGKVEIIQDLFGNDRFVKAQLL